LFGLAVALLADQQLRYSIVGQRQPGVLSICTRSGAALVRTHALPLFALMRCPCSHSCAALCMHSGTQALPLYLAASMTHTLNRSSGYANTRTRRASAISCACTPSTATTCAGITQAHKVWHSVCTEVVLKVGWAQAEQGGLLCHHVPGTRTPHVLDSRGHI